MFSCFTFCRSTLAPCSRSVPSAPHQPDRDQNRHDDDQDHEDDQEAVGETHSVVAVGGGASGVSFGAAPGTAPSVMMVKDSMTAVMVMVQPFSSGVPLKVTSTFSMVNVSFTSTEQVLPSRRATLAIVNVMPESTTTGVAVHVDGNSSGVCGHNGRSDSICCASGEGEVATVGSEIYIGRNDRIPSSDSDCGGTVPEEDCFSVDVSRSRSGTCSMHCFDVGSIHLVPICVAESLFSLTLMDA